MPKSSDAAVRPSASTRYRLMRTLRRRLEAENNEPANDDPVPRRAEAQRVEVAEADDGQGQQANEHDLVGLEDEGRRPEERQGNGEALQHNRNGDVNLRQGGQGGGEEELDEEVEREEELDVEVGEGLNDIEGIFRDGLVEGNDREVQDSSDEDDANDGNAGGDNFVHGAFGNRNLYRDAPVTVRETAALLICHMINHNLTQTCIADLMHILSLVCPREDFVKLSIYKLEKYFNFVPGPYNRKYYCSVCCQALENQGDLCPVCNMRRPVSYFIQCPIIPQLQRMFARPDFYASLLLRFNRQQGHLSDIYDGKLYQDYIHFLAERSNISFTFYTDGVPVWKGRSNSFGGFFFTINELPYKDRVKRENTLLAGLWFGSTKPDPNLFMSSFVDDFRRLYNDGFNILVEGYGRVRVRGFCLAGVADIPAKSAFLNIVGHGGFFGCSACEIRGRTLILGPNSDTHIYPYERNPQKRSPERMIAQAAEAVPGRVRDQHFNVIGVKGPTTLKLFMPNFVRGFAIDPMHLIQGMTRKMLTLFFSSTYSGEGWSLRRVMEPIDETLLNIKPPKFIHRYPESLKDFEVWKASQLKCWLLYYSIPVLRNYMQAIYFNHYLKLVIGLSYLSANSVTHAEVDLAEQLLHEFVREFEELYGPRLCSINLHLLLHLPDCVRDLGPTWVYSCFPYEDMNGQIKRIIHGKNHIDSQVARMHWQHLDMPMKLRFLNEGPVKDYCMNKKKRLRVTERVCASCYTVGSYSERLNDQLIFQVLHNLNVIFTQVRSYNRLLKNAILYVAESYTRDSDSNSTNVAFDMDGNVAYGTIFTFAKAMQCECENLCDCRGEHFAIIRLVERFSNVHTVRDQEQKLKHLFVCRRLMNVIAVPVRSLKNVCFYMEADNLTYLADPVNSFEVE